MNKPAGQPVQEDRTGDLDLLREAKRYIVRKFNKPGDAFVGLVHRLDRPVSGVVVLARTSKSASRLSDQFRRRAIEKEYVALVEGRVTEAREVTSYLRKEKQRVRLVGKKAAGAKNAELRFEPLAVFGKRSLVRVIPSTGRPHQIRVQLSAEGFPISGDLKYGAKAPFDGRNIALHCLRMTIMHPVRREPRTWTAPVPATWPAEVRDHLAALRVPGQLP